MIMAVHIYLRVCTLCKSFWRLIRPLLFPPIHHLPLQTTFPSPKPHLNINKCCRLARCNLWSAACTNKELILSMLPQASLSDIGFGSRSCSRSRCSSLALVLGWRKGRLDVTSSFTGQIMANPIQTSFRGDFGSSSPILLSRVTFTHTHVCHTCTLCRAGWWEKILVVCLIIHRKRAWIKVPPVQI